MGYHNRKSPDHSRPQPRTATNGNATPRQRANTSTARLAAAGQTPRPRRNPGSAFYLIFLAALAALALLK